MNTLLLVGGDLCVRTAAILASGDWKCIGLRRRRVAPTPHDQITWHEGDLRSADSLSFLSRGEFCRITHILYAPSPDNRMAEHGLQSGRVAAPDGPGHWANRIHIDDAARACAHLLNLPHPQSLYIGTDDQPMPTAKLYDELAGLIDGPLPKREWRAPSGKRLSNARLRASGWAPLWPDALEGYKACLGLEE